MGLIHASHHRSRSTPERAATDEILVVEHLTVRFHEREVVSDLSLRVSRGAALAVIGPNGSGKTVFFRALIGGLGYDGFIRWAPDARIGYVPQKLDLDRDLPLTGLELLRARARLDGLPAELVPSTLARVGLPPATAQTLVRQLSGGQFQRLLIAFALLGNPTVLLLDEPTAGIDEPGQERMYDMLDTLRRDGVTILMISHDQSVVTRVATNVLCLTRDHHCFGIGRDALTPQRLSEIYGEPVGVFVHDDGGN